MHIHRYERWWMTFGVFILLAFMSMVFFAAIADNINPPSGDASRPDEGRIDAAVRPSRTSSNGPMAYEAYYVSQVFMFRPAKIDVPVGSTVTFFVTSPDVVHGFDITHTDVNMMVVPGWVNTASHRFRENGTYLLVCNEYCGIGHQNMFGKVEVRDVRGRTGTPARTAFHRAYLHVDGGDRFRRGLRRLTGVFARESRRTPGVVRLLSNAHNARHPHGARVHDLLHYGFIAVLRVSLRPARPQLDDRMDRMVVMIVGTAMAAPKSSRATRRCSIRFTHRSRPPSFYIGATLLIVGTWVVAYDLFENAVYFRRTTAGTPLPLPVFMAAATFLMWIIATLGVVVEMAFLIPWSSGGRPASTS